MDGRLCALELSTDYLGREQLAKAITPAGSNCKLVANPDLTSGVFLPIDIKFADRKAYYQAFDAFSQEDDVSSMVQLMGRYVLEMTEQYLSVWE